MAPRLPRRVPWTSVAELDQICSWIFADDNDLDSKLLAVHKISAWKTVTVLPHAMESTLSLLVVIMEDKSSQRSSFVSLSLRQNYASAIIRLVNGLVDPLQSGAYARSIASISEQLGLPSWLVELRHAATHEDLPSLELLQEGARQSMAWLFQHYWLPTVSPYTAPKAFHKLRSLGPALKEYKRLLKATTRDHTLKTTHQHAIAKVAREVERWLGEAKVAADMGGDGGDQESKEIFALEKLSDELLQKGVLVPLSKKKRVFPLDSFLPPPSLIEIWSPLILQIQSLHSEFCGILIQRIISAVIPSPTIESSHSVSFDSCIARWAMWLADSCQPDDSDSTLKKDAIIALITGLGPKIPSSKSTPVQLLEALCAGDDQYQVALSYLSSQDIQFSSWQSDDISVMTARLRELLDTIIEDVPRIDTSEAIPKLSTPASELAVGWTLLDSSRWKPCPLGVHYAV